MSTELPRQFFKLDQREAAVALRDAYQDMMGKAPSPKVLGLLLGQTALETGRWNLPNYNWGGVKARKSDEFFQYLSCGEIIDGKEVKWKAEDRAPECKFVAFQSARDGARHYLETLRRRGHWWGGLHTGEVEGFIRGLTTAPKYFTASPRVYGRTLRKLSLEFEPLAKAYGAGPATFFERFADHFNIVRRVLTPSKIPPDVTEGLGMFARISEYLEGEAQA